MIRIRIIILLLLCIFFPLTQLGCGNEDTVGNGNSEEVNLKNGFSEYDFVSDPNVRVLPENVAAIFLEPADASNTDMPDTDGSGMDFIPLQITDGNWFIYSLDISDNTIESAVMIDSDGSEIFRLDRDSPENKVFLNRGNYSLLVTSGYTANENNNADHRVVFLCPDMGNKSSEEVDNSSKSSQDPFKLALRVNSAPWSNLRGINLAHANLTSADLYYSNLRDANLNAASFEKANLEGADMREAILYASNLKEVNLHTANLDKADFHAANMQNANLSAATLDEAYMYAANMENIDLADASMKNVNLYAANLTRANLISADLSGANLFSAEMENVNLMAACLDNAYLYSANLAYGNLEGATLRKANLATAYLYKASLHNADLTSANLADADFSYSVLKNAILTGAILEGTDFTGADTTGVVW